MYVVIETTRATYYITLFVINLAYLAALLLYQFLLIPLLVLFLSLQRV